MLQVNTKKKLVNLIITYNPVISGIMYLSKIGLYIAFLTIVMFVHINLTYTLS